MPKIQDIERFKRDLAALAKEAEVLERWGEKPDVITPPEGAAAAGETEPPPLGDRVVEEQEGMPPDFAALLEDLPLDREEGAGPVDEDIAALLESAEEEEGVPGPVETPDLESTPDFAMPDFDAQSSDEAASPAEAIAESAESGEAPEALPFEGGLAEPVAETTPEEEVEDFSIPDFSLAEEEPAADASGRSAEPFGEDFSIPDLGSGEEAAKEPEKAGPEESLSLGATGRTRMPSRLSASRSPPKARASAAPSAAGRDAISIRKSRP